MSTAPTKIIGIHGLVLRRSPLGETDQIITVYTEQLGKIRVTARGSLRAKSAWRGRFEPFHQIEAEIFRSSKSSLFRFNHADVITRPKVLLGHLTALNAAFLILECLDRYCEPENPNLDLYATATAALDKIDRNPGNAVYFSLCFCFRFFVLSGYGINWSHCANCNRERAFNKSAYCIPADGGVICTNCAGADQKQKEWIVSADILWIVESAAAGKIIKPDEIKDMKKFSSTALRLVREIFAHHLDTIPKTLKILETSID
ncbi:MAG: DNA repair protein RecO [bacterium]